LIGLITGITLTYILLEINCACRLTNMHNHLFIKINREKDIYKNLYIRIAHTSYLCKEIVLFTIFLSILYNQYLNIQIIFLKIWIIINWKMFECCIAVIDTWSFSCFNNTIYNNLYCLIEINLKIFNKNSISLWHTIIYV